MLYSGGIQAGISHDSFDKDVQVGTLFEGSQRDAEKIYPPPRAGQPFRQPGTQGGLAEQPHLGRTL
jgi:hypothetical protein